MPNNILITPGSASIQFSGSAANTIRLQVEPSGSVAFYGNSGSLFGIADSLSGSLMSVNDISGIPILEVFSDDRVVMGTLNSNALVVTGSRVGVGINTPSSSLHITGTTTLQQILEKNQTVAGAASGSINFDVLNQGVVYYTSNSTANWLLNFRGDASTSLNAVMYIGQSLSIAFIATNGSPAYYPVSHSVDGASVTVRWAENPAPSSGNANTIEAYSYTLFKTANATFTVLASRTVFF
jgi:hypothetical protein